jgi:hypothetical protein
MVILVGLTSSAVVADIVGIEPLLGAFLAGLGLNYLVPNESALMERVDFYGNALFIPAFLVSVGLLFDPAVMFQRSTIWLALWLSVALVVGKITAAWLTGRIYRLTGAESGLLFSVSVAQAAATLAATIIGLELGLYGDEVVNAVMVVIAVSLFVTSVGTPKFAAQIEQPNADERRLGEVVLVPAHGYSSDLATRLRFAGRIAEGPGGLIFPVVIAIPHQDQDLFEARTRKDEIDDTLHALGLEGDSRIRVDRSLAEGISQAALENNASIVLLNWSGPRPRSALFAESVADEISRLVECPVAVAAISESITKRVILAISKYDLKASRIDALAVAASMAATLAARQPLIVGPLEPELLAESGIILPEKTEYILGDPNIIKWVEQNVDKESLVISLTRGQAFEKTAAKLYQLGCSIVFVTTY